MCGIDFRTASGGRRAVCCRGVAPRLKFARGVSCNGTQYKLYGTEVLNLFVRRRRHAPGADRKTQKLKYNDVITNDPYIVSIAPLLPRLSVLPHPSLVVERSSLLSSLSLSSSSLSLSSSSSLSPSPPSSRLSSSSSPL